MKLNKSLMSNIILVVVSVIISLSIGEIILRIVLKDKLNVWVERNLMFNHDSELGWFPIHNSTFYVNNDIYKHNSSGFRDIEQKPDTTKSRIIFIGDSFVWGYGVDQQDVFTVKLRKRLPNVQVFNFGVSGYGTDQEYLLLKKHMNHINPNIVFLQFTNHNDEDDNSTDMRQGTYYKPYFVIDNNGIKLCGVPVPKSVEYFIAGSGIINKCYLARFSLYIFFKHIYPAPPVHENPTDAIIIALRDYVHLHGAVLLVGLQRSHPRIEKLLNESKITYINLDTPLRFSWEEHWTPAGHSFVSDRLAEFILKGGYLSVSK